MIYIINSDDMPQGIFRKSFCCICDNVHFLFNYFFASLVVSYLFFVLLEPINSRFHKYSNKATSKTAINISSWRQILEDVKKVRKVEKYCSVIGLLDFATIYETGFLLCP